MKRSQQLDFFRGIMLILITVDHFLSDKDLIRYFTYEFVGWVTAAEGFVFLSGLTAGIVYTRKLNEQGENFVNTAVKKRAWLIYRNHVVILLFALVAVLFGYGLNEYWINDYSLLSEKPFLSIALGAIFLYQPTYLDILPMYAVFILFVPVVIKYLKKGFIWQLFVCSIAIYLIPIFNGFNLLNSLTKIRNIDTGFFNLLSWQFLFFLGLFSGFSYYSGKARQWMNSKIILAFSLVICSAIFIAKHTHVNLDGLEYLISRGTLGPIRLLNCLSIIFVIIFISSKKSAWFASKPVCYLGRYSLEVFSFHVVFVIIFKPLNDLVSNIYSIQITNHFFIYPLASIMFLFLVVPSLFLAPTLLKEKIYTLNGNDVKPLRSEDWLTNAKALIKNYKQMV